MKKIVDPEEDAKVDDANEKTLSVPADTPLAYNVCELYVKLDGALELIIASGCRCVVCVHVCELIRETTDVCLCVSL